MAIYTYSDKRNNSSVGYKYDHDDGVSYYFQSNLLGGTNALNGDLVWEYRAIFRPPADIPAEVFREDTIFKSLQINCSATPDGKNTAGYYVKIYIPDNPFEYLSAEKEWNAAEVGTLLESAWQIFSGNSQKELIVTDKDIIKKILKNGLSFVPYDTPPPVKAVAEYYEHHVEVIYTLDYSTALTKPTVELVNGYYNKISITESYILNWIYLQEANSPQTEIDLDIAGVNSEYKNILTKYSFRENKYRLQPDCYPAPQIVENNTYIRLRAYSEEGVVSDYTAGALILIFPSAQKLCPGGGEAKLSSDTIRLQWSITAIDGDGNSYNITNYPTKFDLQYSINSGESWYDLAVNYTAFKDGDTYYYDIPANTLPSGVITWRVRPYVNSYVIDNYTQETFVVRVQASTSSVTCDGKPRPTISWSSSAQIAYQVRFSDYDSGAIYGAETSHTIPYYYADGTYPVQVRTQASDGTWSDWTELEYVTIKNTAPGGTLTISAVRTRHTAVISWESTTAFDTYILYRNGIPVYIGNALTYTDVAAYGSCDYYVRGISGVNYLQSETVTIDAIPAVDCMYDTQTAQWIPLKYSLQSRVRNYSDTANVAYKSYAGRSYPVAYVDGTKERQANLSYAFKTREEAEQLKSSLGHLVIYKDTAGGRIIGILGAISWSVTKRFAANLTIVQVDFKEDMRYET